MFLRNYFMMYILLCEKTFYFYLPNVCSVCYLLLLKKTKPTQHSVRGLRGLGLTPNILACRSTKVS
jgi:CTP synthase (UTP-ammonia lyase)